MSFLPRAEAARHYWDPRPPENFIEAIQNKYGGKKLTESTLQCVTAGRGN